MEPPIYLPEQSETTRAGLSSSLCEAMCKHRNDVLSALRRIPTVVGAAEKLVDDGSRYRVLISKEHLHLLREGADGITKPSLRDAKGRFVENVDLIRISPDIAGALAAVAIQVAMTELSVKLDAVIRSVENLATLTRAANPGALQGAIDALEVARHLRDDKDRRAQMLGACGGILNEVGKVAEQMKVHIAQMPSPETGLWTGWRGDGLEQAEKAHAAVLQDFSVLAEGLRRVVATYFDLGEFIAAQIAFSTICTRLTEADLQAAADRARLLPYPKGGPGPEHAFEGFLSEIPAMEARLQLLAAGETPELEFDFEVGEVCG